MQLYWGTQQLHGLRLSVSCIRYLFIFTTSTRLTDLDNVSEYARGGSYKIHRSKDETEMQKKKRPYV